MAAAWRARLELTGASPCRTRAWLIRLRRSFRGGVVEAACDPSWRVALSPQYQTDDGLWHGGRRVFNHIYYPDLNTYFGAGSHQTVDLACCILYWDNGDGTEAFRPLCQYPWRIHAGFWTETPLGPAKFADAYSDAAPATCAP